MGLTGTFRSALVQNAITPITNNTQIHRFGVFGMKNTGQALRRTEGACCSEQRTEYAMNGSDRTVNGLYPSAPMTSLCNSVVQGGAGSRSRGNGSR